MILDMATMALTPRSGLVAWTDLPVVRMVARSTPLCAVATLLPVCSPTMMKSADGQVAVVGQPFGAELAADFFFGGRDQDQRAF